jgi:serine/threonine-protein kinase
MPESSPLPLTIGRYALHTEIASGGMAAVHFARLVGPAGFSRIVAAKRLLPHMVRDGAFTAMLMDEARLAARIRHPNVVSTLDVVSTGEELVVVMEYVHGESLSRLAQTATDLGEPISLPFATSIIIDALHGLHAAHEARDEAGLLLGVVHRDISPQNLLVGVEGVTRIADFGIAKAAGRSYQTRDGTIKGKLAYMAPEQIERGELTRATDVFAISIVLWELITGRQLFDGVTDAEVMHRVLTYQIPSASEFSPSLPSAYDRILQKGLSRDPSQRFGSAREMALELEAVSTPVRASEIGAWVERIASDTLARRALAISRIERSTTDETAMAPTKPVTPSPKSLSEPPNTAAKVSWAGDEPRRGSSALSFVAVLAAALGGVAALLWTSGKQTTSPTVPATASFAAVATAAAPTEPPAPISASSSVAPPAPSAPGVAQRPPGAKPQGAPPTKAKPPADCNPPYSIDPSGRRIFKLECM